jgi:phosphopantetheinyl transferase
MDCPHLYLAKYSKTNGPGRIQAKSFFARWLSCAPEGIIYDETTEGRPFLLNHPDMEIGISHSNGILSAYIGPVRAGIDIEYIRKKRDFTGISEMCFTNDEQREIYSHDPERESVDYQNFYRIWTRKEALLKFSGKGLAELLHMPQAPLPTCRHWMIEGLYILCLATSKEQLYRVEIETELGTIGDGSGIVPL